MSDDYIDSATMGCTFYEPSYKWSGPQKLWFAVFQSGLEKFMKLIVTEDRNKLQQKEFETLRTWFFAPAGNLWPGSFLGICNNLDLSSAIILKKLRACLDPEGGLYVRIRAENFKYATDEPEDGTDEM